jgi:Kef-type K+ transport system membrane component KefB
MNIELLVFISVGIFIIPLIAPFFRIPTAVGELLFGILIGWLISFFNLSMEIYTILKFLSFIGFALLMFLAGLEIDWNLIEELKFKEKIIIFLVVLTNFFAAWLYSKIFKLSFSSALLLASMGIGLMLVVLKELNLPRDFSQKILITGSVGEVLTLLILTFYDLHLSYGTSKIFIIKTLIILVVFFSFYFFLKLVRLLVWYFPQKFAFLLEEDNKNALDVRASFAFMLLFIVIFNYLHIEPILGAFIAGTIFGYVFREKETLEKKLSTIGYGFIIPFFFLQVGTLFNINQILENPTFIKIALQLAVGIIVIKLISSFWYYFLGFSFFQIIQAGLLFSFPFTMLIAIGKILYEKGVFSQVDFSIDIILTLLTSFLFPFFLKILHRKQQKKEEKFRTQTALNHKPIKHSPRGWLLKFLRKVLSLYIFY